MIRFCQNCNQERADTSWSDHFGTRLCVDCYNLRCETEQPERCAACDGESKVERPAPTRDDPYLCVVVDCNDCQGHGWL